MVFLAEWSQLVHLLAALLADEDEGVPEEEKITFHARAVGVRVPPHGSVDMQLIDSPSRTNNSLSSYIRFS